MSAAWLPNILSLSNLFFGFLSILAALRGRFDIAAILIFAAMLMDMFDGRLARLIKAENPMGKHLDSLADLLSFGVAPGIIFYAAFLGQKPIYSIWPNPEMIPNFIHLGIGTLAFIFPLFTALRLAKFNTLEYADHFEGCPSPVAGGTVVVLISFQQIPGFFIDGFLKPFNIQLPYQIMIALFVIIGLLMILKVRFTKIQRIILNASSFKSLKGIILNIMLFLVFILFSKFFLMILSLLYITVPIVNHLFVKRKA